MMSYVKNPTKYQARKIYLAEEIVIQLQRMNKKLNKIIDLIDNDTKS